MEAFVRIFLHGEALQRMFACVCNNSNCDVQNKIGRIVSSISRTTLCIRLTPIGLAPFRNDITMVLPYSMMDRAQLDFLGTIMDQAIFVASSSHPPPSAVGNSIRAMGIGNEVTHVEHPLERVCRASARATCDMCDAGGGGDHARWDPHLVRQPLT